MPPPKPVYGFTVTSSLMIEPPPMMTFAGTLRFLASNTGGRSSDVASRVSPPVFLSFFHGQLAVFQIEVLQTLLQEVVDLAVVFIVVLNASDEAPLLGAIRPALLVGRLIYVDLIELRPHCDASRKDNRNFLGHGWLVGLFLLDVSE